MKTANKIYVIMYHGIIDDIIDFWGTELQSEHGFFTDKKEAEAFRDELNAKNGFEYDISDDCEQQYFYICEIEAHGK